MKISFTHYVKGSILTLPIVQYFEEFQQVYNFLNLGEATVLSFFFCQSVLLLDIHDSQDSRVSKTNSNPPLILLPASQTVRH